jgi:hypothetical protein
VMPASRRRTPSSVDPTANHRAPSSCKAWAHYTMAGGVPFDHRTNDDLPAYMLLNVSKILPQVP